MGKQLSGWYFCTMSRLVFESKLRLPFTNRSSDDGSSVRTREVSKLWELGHLYSDRMDTRAVNDKS